jgi:exosortase A-associated hydrolase 2
MNEQRGYLTVDGRPLYCTLFLPERGTACWGVAVAEPFGEEKRCAARMLVRMARKLARQQVATIKFDFSGTGDSAGDSAKAQWTYWQQELEAAMKLLQQESKAAKIALLGTRAGALLAAQCAAKNPVQALLLAEPFLSGEEILDELEKRQKIKDAILGGASTPAASQLWAMGQSADFAGFQVNAQFAAQIRQDNLLESMQKCPGSCRMLLLKVSGARKFPPAWQNLLELLGKHPGSQALLIKDKPFWGQLEYYESDAVIDPIMEFLAAANSQTR